MSEFDDFLGRAKLAARRMTADLICKGFKPEALHVYTHADGSPEHCVIRLLPPPGENKWMRPMTWTGPGPDDFILSAPERPTTGRPLYKLSDLHVRQEEPVWIVEGEKCTDALMELGLLTTTSGSATSATGADWTPLAGRTVVVWPDNDVPGMGYAQEVAKKLNGLAASVMWVDVAPLELPDGGDCVDWLEKNPDATAASVMALGRSAAVDFPVLPVTNPDWPEPQPFIRLEDQNPYPTDALPQIIREAVEEYHDFGQQPVPIIAASALACVSLSVQGMADVERDSELIGPVSLSFVTLATSGERKTAADRKFSAPIRDWEQARGDESIEKIKEAEALTGCWEAQLESIKKSIRAVDPGDTKKVIELQKQLLDHTDLKPSPVVAPRLMYENITPEALAQNLENGHPSASLWSDEGGLVTGSHGMNHESMLSYMTTTNRLWDGGSLRHDRKQAKSIHVQGVRLTVNLMFQPAIFDELSARSGGLARSSGFLARFLIAAPASTMGTRPYRPPPEGVPALNRFHARVKKILDRPLPLDEHGRLDLFPCTLAPQAFEVWRNYHDAVEAEIGEHGKYRSVCDFAAKSAEQAVRLAACFHLFTEGIGVITGDTMYQAIAIAEWHLNEALRVLGTGEEQQDRADARLLEKWLITKGGVAPMRGISNSGPSQLRKNERRDPALEVLYQLGRARLENENGQTIVRRNPKIQALESSSSATFATTPNLSPQAGDGIGQTTTTGNGSELFYADPAASRSTSQSPVSQESQMSQSHGDKKTAEVPGTETGSDYEAREKFSI